MIHPTPGADRKTSPARAGEVEARSAEGEGDRVGTNQPSPPTVELRQRNGHTELRLNGWELMSTRAHHSEDALAALACDRLATSNPTILLGGLGLGYTLRALLNRLPATSRVIVAELLPEIIAWHRDNPATAGPALADPRVILTRADIADLIHAAAPASYDAILLDVDNGPDVIMLPGNAALYDHRGLRRIRRVLRPGGTLAVWSADRSPAFEQALQAAAFTGEAHDIPARGGPDDPLHTVYLAQAAP